MVSSRSSTCREIVIIKLNIMIVTFPLPFTLSHSLAQLHDTHLVNVNTQGDPEDPWAGSSDYQIYNVVLNTQS